MNAVETMNGIENEIVTSLLAHMKLKGFVPTKEVSRGFDTQRVRFDGGSKGSSWVLLIPGNGRDIISDWGMPAESEFNAAMESFLDTNKHTK